MRATFCILLGLCTVPAFALVPKPYIGGTLQVNSPTGSFSGSDILHEEGGAKTGIGGEIDVGITGRVGSAYVGYRFGKHKAEAEFLQDITPVKADGDWKINRVVLGARWHLLGSLPTPVLPTLGGGVTIGKTTAAVGGEAGGTRVETAKDSKSSVGYFVEGGVIVRGPGNLSLIGGLQYHSFDADYSSDLYNGKVKIAFFTFQAGVRIKLI